MAAPDPASANHDPALDPAPYQALYRRYRPQRFADVLGQEHITRALRHAVRDHKVAHAYLFSGPRGTGKTSTARILAMALNCEHPDDGEPDGTCPSCVAIRQGTSLDVQELDSATNRGIDEMRDLLGRVALGTPGPVEGVHHRRGPSDDLGGGERPAQDPRGSAGPRHLRAGYHRPSEGPAHHPQPNPALRVPPARRRSAGLSASRYQRSVRPRRPPEAIDLVVRRGHGSARDALSALDQVAAAGTVDDEATILSDIVEAIADRDPGRVLLEVAEAISAGRDPRRLGTDLLEQLRDGFLATQARSLVLLADDAAAAVEAQARRLGTAALVRAMEVIGQALIDMRDAPDPRITLEVALVRLAAVGADDSRSALLVRIERLERVVGESGDGGQEAPVRFPRSARFRRPPPPIRGRPRDRRRPSPPPWASLHRPRLRSRRLRRPHRPSPRRPAPPAGPPAPASPVPGRAPGPARRPTPGGSSPRLLPPSARPPAGAARRSAIRRALAGGGPDHLGSAAAPRRPPPAPHPKPHRGLCPPGRS